MGKKGFLIQKLQKVFLGAFFASITVGVKDKITSV